MIEKQSKAQSLPASLVPTPTHEYHSDRQSRSVTRVAAWRRRRPIPIPYPRPIPIPFWGSRVLIWKQDPTVQDPGIRTAFIPTVVFTGPRDARIKSMGLPAVSANAFGDFIHTPGTDAFDAVHTFAVVRQTLTMLRRSRGGVPVPWHWNVSGNSDPLDVHAHGLPGTMNAYYSRTQKALKFGDFDKPGSSPPEHIYTCRSLDIVAHEAGHAILDGLKPSWLGWGNPPQTGGLHESFGDLTAIFLALSQMDQVEALIALTKARLHNKNFLEDFGEQFGDALGRPNGLRNADNNLKLSEVSTEVHAISNVFTGAIYDILADIFVFERKIHLKDDAAVLYDVAQYLWSLVLRAIINAPASKATFADVANEMLKLAASDGKPVQYRNFIRNRFTFREVVVSPTPLTADIDDDLVLEAAVQDEPDAVQNRIGCCGTMNLLEYVDDEGEEKLLEKEIEEFQKALG